MIALTHGPSRNLQAGERTHVPQTAIDHALAARQHAAYCRALADCGASVLKLAVNADKPDGTFIEDTAVILDEVAILCSMGAASRREEPGRIEPILREYREVVKIELPAIIEGGDVLRVGRRLLVGQSSRTNAAGIAALAAIGRRCGYEVTPVPVTGCLHLKTACTALPDGRLLVNPDWIETIALADWQLLPVSENEPWSANIGLINDHVLASDAYPQTAALLDKLGFKLKTIHLSEFAKAEGGVTCLSLLIS
jgi:dimethylargininase